MESNQPAISVVIPVKERRDSLIRAIKSVKSQTYPVREIIVVDDGSRIELGKDLLHQFPDVIYLRNERSMGAPFSRNRGWKSASTDLIAFLDSDDEMTPGCLNNKVSKLIGDDLDMVVGSFAVEEKGIVRPFHFKVHGRVPLRDHLLTNSPFDARTSTFVIRRAVLEKISFDEKLKKHQDWDLFINVDFRHRTGFTDHSDVILHISETDRISTKLHHESTKYFIEKNKDKVSADAIFLFTLKMLYKSAIRDDREGTYYYRSLVVNTTRGIHMKYRLIAVLIRFNFLNVSFLRFLKRILRPS